MGRGTEGRRKRSGPAANHHHRVFETLSGRNSSADLAATLTLTDYDPPLQFLDPGGANRDVVLPAENESIGLMFMIFHNGAANNLIVKDDGGNTILTIVNAEAGMVACDGTNWWGFMGGVT